MQKIIVTGANGQLGSEIKQLAVQYPEFEFVYTDIDTLDLSNKAELTYYIQQHQPDYLINCAAYTAVDKAEEDSTTAELINAIVPQTIAQLAKRFNFKFIHISTDYVFSGEHFKPISESTATAPASVYGKTKLLGEELVRKETDAIIIRTSWLYSKYGNNFIKNMLNHGSKRAVLGVVFDQTGTPTNAADLASAILSIIDQHKLNKKWHSGVYHYSNEGVCTWYDFAHEIMQIAGLNCKVKPILTHEYPLPAPRPAYSVMNKQKIKDTYDIDIPYWKTSLTITLNELLKKV
jgi:dTDP-4-dehydrorhamnose reductase